MTQQPLFSVLIANYNNGCYLQEAIDSVLKQDYPNWEIIIIDDKSTDESYKIYDKYKKDSRVHIFFNKENRGAGYTKRRCVEEAKGEICGFLDPDDVLYGNDVFDIMVNEHRNHPEASMVYSEMYQTDERLNIIKQYDTPLLSEGESLLESRSWALHHFLTFKRGLYQKTEGIDPYMKRAVDYDMYYKLEEVGTIIHVDNICYMIRCNPHSISMHDNAYKAAAWHSYTCAQAMKRRGLTDESLFLFPIKEGVRREFQKGTEKVMSSRIYRLGKFIVSPLLLIMQLRKK